MWTWIPTGIPGQQFHRRELPELQKPYYRPELQHPGEYPARPADPGQHRSPFPEYRRLLRGKDDGCAAGRQRGRRRYPLHRITALLRFRLLSGLRGRKIPSGDFTATLTYHQFRKGWNPSIRCRPFLTHGLGLRWHKGTETVFSVSIYPNPARDQLYQQSSSRQSAVGSQQSEL